MDVFTMVAVIVVVSCAAGVVNNYLKNQRLSNKVSVNEDLLGELDEMRARIEVLEKIVTDDKYRLSREISDLERSA